MIYALAFDIGTTGVKSCLFRIDSTVTKLDSASATYPLHILPGGGAEQDPEDWWAAIRNTTQQLTQRHSEEMSQLAGISFCAQMQAMVMVDAQGVPVHRAFSYMDQRAGQEMRNQVGQSPRIAGVNALTALRTLKRTGAVAASVKDPVWKYHWLRTHEPEEFSRGYKWLDVKEALIARMTGEFVMSRDSAFATLLLDVHSEPPRFDEVTMRLLGVDPQHMPRIVESSEVVGPLLPEIGRELGLPAGTPVYAGGGDASLIGVGAGATDIADSHVYMGTSGWVITVTDKQSVDLSSMIASIVGASPGLFNYFAELETAGKCLEWVRDHLALDEINIFLEKLDITQSREAQHSTLYDYLSEVISRAEPGSGGVLFAPWLHGNRSPFEDPLARAMFVNISLETGKTELLRAVVEGVCLHMRWFLEIQSKKIPTSQRLRFVGGGALSAVTAQILSDVTQRPVDVVKHPQDVGAVGAALLVAVGEDVIEDVRHAKDLVEVEKSYSPNPANREIYDRQFAAFTQLHQSNRRIFKILNRG